MPRVNERNMRWERENLQRPKSTALLFDAMLYYGLCNSFNPCHDVTDYVPTRVWTVFPEANGVNRGLRVKNETVGRPGPCPSDPMRSIPTFCHVPFGFFYFSRGQL